MAILVGSVVAAPVPPTDRASCVRPAPSPHRSRVSRRPPLRDPESPGLAWVVRTAGDCNTRASCASPPVFRRRRSA